MTRIGTRERHVEVKRSGGRYPTVKGENPPRGLAFKNVQVWLWPSRRVVELRWWRW